MIALLGWAGAAVLVIAYALVSAKRVAGDGAAFQLMNVAGAIALAVNCAVNGAWPSVALNIVWTAIGAVAIFRLMPSAARKRRRARRKAADAEV